MRWDYSRFGAGASLDLDPSMGLLCKCRATSMGGIAY